MNGSSGARSSNPAMTPAISREPAAGIRPSARTRRRRSTDACSASESAANSAPSATITARSSASRFRPRECSHVGRARAGARAGSCHDRGSALPPWTFAEQRDHAHESRHADADGKDVEVGRAHPVRHRQIAHHRHRHHGEDVQKPFGWFHDEGVQRSEENRPERTGSAQGRRATTRLPKACRPGRGLPSSMAASRMRTTATGATITIARRAPRRRTRQIKVGKVPRRR